MNEKGNTIRLHRVLKTSADKVYRAFLDSDAMAQWLPPNGFTCSVHSRDAVVGGKYHMSFTNFTNQTKHSWKGEYLELVPGKLIKCSEQFDNPNMPGKILITVTLKDVMCGVELVVVQENVPSVIPPEMCYLGWQESLEKLARLVEPDIKG